MPQTLIQPKVTADRNPRRRGGAYLAVAVSVLLVGAIALVFGQSLRFGFLHYDDNSFIFSEPHISGGFTLRNVVWTFTEGPLGEWYPLAMLSHMLDCQLFGLEAGWHHLTNLILHSATSIGLFLVLWRMTGQRAVPEAAQVSGARVALAGPSATTLWPSAVVAGIFAIHPLHVESVVWVAERRDVLSGLFFVLILAAYDHYVRRPESWGRYSLVALLLVLGLMSKPMLVTVPPLLLLLDYWPLRRFGAAQSARRGGETPGARPFPWRVVLEKIPLLAIAVADAGVTFATHGSRTDPLTFPERLANAAISCVAYILQSFVPVGLNIFYSHPEAGRPAWQVIGAVIVLLAITGAAIFWRRSLPYLFVGWFWYVGMLVPVLGIAYVASHARADRYTYLSQIGLSISLVWGVKQLTAAWPARRWVLGVGSAVMLAALMACAWRQTTFWQNDVTLWQRALACDPGNPVAEYMIGDSLAPDDADAAVGWFSLAARHDPNQRIIYAWPRAKAFNALGNIAAQKSHQDEAIADFKNAIEIDPTFDAAEMNLGIQLAQAGDLDQAALHFQRGRELAPRSAATSWCNLAIGQMANRRIDEAIANFRKALELDDSLILAHLQLGSVLAERGETDEAIHHFRRVIKLDPNIALAYYRLAELLGKQGKTTEAARYREQGARVSHRFAESRNSLGADLARQGQLDQAIAQFQTAISIVPDFVLAYQNLGEALTRQGRFDEAEATYRRALQIDPGNQILRQRLEQLHR